MSSGGASGSGYTAPPALQHYTRTGRYVGRGGDVKVKRKCLEVACQASVVFLLATIATTVLATVMLSYGLTGEYWEMLTYDLDKVNEIVAGNSSTLSVKWLFDGRVPVVSYESFRTTPPEPPRYLLPLHSGVWISCIDLQGKKKTYQINDYFAFLIVLSV